MNTTIDIKTEGDTVIVREGKALELKEPTPVRISGVLDSPLMFLKQRMGTLLESDCNVLVNREAGTITLTVDERSFYKDIITGILSFTQDFIKFGINTGAYLTPYDMAQLFKMNRSCFENQTTAMNLVTHLVNFKAKIDKEIEKSENGRGDKRLLIAQVVTSNVPEKFNIAIPIFKGVKNHLFEVEIMINPNDLTCTLQSPQANDLIRDIKDEAIGGVINGIREIAQGIVIIEQ